MLAQNSEHTCVEDDESLIGHNFEMAPNEGISPSEKPASITHPTWKPTNYHHGEFDCIRSHFCTTELLSQLA